MSDERRKRADGAYGYAADAQRERAYGYAANAQRERAEKAEAARDDARRKHKQAEAQLAERDAEIARLRELLEQARGADNEQRIIAV